MVWSRSRGCICRELPLLEHNWIQHDPITATALRNVLDKERGLTLVTGSTASRRTFLINALGRSFTRVSAGHFARQTRLD